MGPVIPLIPAVLTAAKLLKTKAGREAIKKGSSSVIKFLREKGLTPNAARQAAAKKSAQTRKTNAIALPQVLTKNETKTLSLPLMKQINDEVVAL